MDHEKQLYNIFLEKQGVEITKKLIELFPDATDEQLELLEQSRQSCFAAGFEIGMLYAKINKK